MGKFRAMAGDYWDQQLFDLIAFGFPLDVGTQFQPSNHNINHASAINYPDEVNKYVNKEVGAGALHSLDYKEFNFYHTSPLMPRPKEGSSRRIIPDLSWPKENEASVNSCVPVDSYLNSKFLLKLPTVDTICNIINTFTVPVRLFKVDLARAFRQIPLDPLDAAYVGIHWQGMNYVDTAVLFGWRHGSDACQRITDAIRHILKKYGVIVVNYIDDLISIAPVDVADRAFRLTLHVLCEIGLVIANDKMVPPCVECTCLGIIINTSKQNLCIPPDKLRAVIGMCNKYLNYKKISKVQIQSLLGNLIYIHKAVSPARLFVNRIIALLKVAPEWGYVQVGANFKRDLNWFTAFAVLYNGFTKFNSAVKQPDQTVYVDACLTGLGGR
jgi:hypothetical protein